MAGATFQCVSERRILYRPSLKVSNSWRTVG